MRQVVKEFAEYMESRLKEKDATFDNGKNSGMSWHEDGLLAITNEFYRRADLLNEEVKDYLFEPLWDSARIDICRQAVDVANFAMMVFDIMRKK